MKKSEKVGIIIVAVLAVVFTVSIFAGGSSGNKKAPAKDICEIMCRPMNEEQDEWGFPKMDPDAYYNNDGFYTKEECISACKAARERR